MVAYAGDQTLDSQLLCSLALFWAAQDSRVDPQPEARPDCSQVRCRGRRVGHWLNQFEFCVPRGLKFHRVAGVEGDIHDRITFRERDEVSELVMFTANITWGPVKSSPNDWPSEATIRGGAMMVREWQCSEVVVTISRSIATAEIGGCWLSRRALQNIRTCHREQPSN